LSTTPQLKPPQFTGILSSDELLSLQHQLETLLAENIDNQKQLSGEIAYLNSGDYPKLDVSNRPMPVYTLLPRLPSDMDMSGDGAGDCKPGHSRHSSTRAEMSLADLGLNSSHEGDDGPEPCILDVPRRFWRWSREYLKHVNEEYVLEFREKLVERFSAEAIQKYLEGGFNRLGVLKMEFGF